jgi:hypothetical protein
MKIVYPTSSPYSATPQTSWYINRFVFRSIPPDSGDVPITLQQIHELRPDRLSFQLYGTPNYWWVFCVRNPFLRGDPILGFLAGLTIIVPSATHISNVLGR